ncbi:Hypothetical predicted protein [Prunus dulcis]|uniref:Uncharacterized protein n=1 Tax=Prunus dulcis TaxID=3755 RepID=A0A5E4GFW2_PRUDU|nr:hypothetical protein L3X38_040731 [Prunus dulcis]VVA38737.1 Hypothetical predicted protein [Prunus dulcis]
MNGFAQQAFSMDNTTNMSQGQPSLQSGVEMDDKADERESWLYRATTTFLLMSHANKLGSEVISMHRRLRTSPDRMLSMVPGSRSMRTARGTYRPPEASF